MAWFPCNIGGGSAPQSKSISYLKWQILKTRGIPANGSLQVAEFYLYQNGELYNWGSNVSITSDMVGVSGETIDKLIDGLTNTKFNTNEWGSVQINECNIVISLGETITLDAHSTYSFCTPNDESSRDPVSWKLFGSMDGTNWELLDKRTDTTVPTDRYRETINFPMQYVGGSERLYTNSVYYTTQEQITDVSEFTKLYDTSSNVDYGNRGSRVETDLGRTDESIISSYMNNGWQDGQSCYYDSENHLGAYAGYDFGEELYIVKAKIWLGRYSGQSKDIPVVIQYLDSNGNWNDLQTVTITRDLSYPLNIFEINISRSIYGIRWIHKTETKTSGNNVCFFGMTLYKGTGDSIDVYVPESTGLNEIPDGYDGFGPIVI